MDREIDGEADFQILQQRGLLSFTETYDPARAEQYHAHKKANDQKIRVLQTASIFTIGKLSTIIQF